MDFNLSRFKHHDPGEIKYDVIFNFYTTLHEDENVVYDSRVQDIDIDKYIDKAEFNETEFNKLK